LIHGVVVKKLVDHVDERGFFREIIRVTDEFFGEGFGQLSHSCMYPGVVKAWHVHPTQIDWWYVPIGALKVVLHDLRADSPTCNETQELLMGEPYDAKVLRIPAGVAHGCKVIGSVTHLFYVTSRTYDPAEEGRIPHDDPRIGYDWLAGPEIR
jgi:dTDP-4-dehydrorhamnose 3,5-epimerase